MYDATQIADWFISRAKRDGRVLSIMALLKLVYISHGWHLETKKLPLFPNKIEAWQYGPVVADVYNAFRKQGVDISFPMSSISSIEGLPVTKLLEQIYDIYGNLSPFQLSAMTHEPGGPWDISMKVGGWYAKIPDELIQAHYEMKRLKSK